MSEAADPAITVTAAATAAALDDESAFGELAQRFRRELHVHCYRILGSFTEAEDLVQEALLRAWRHRDGFEPGTNFRAWLYRIATNACLDHLRRTARRPPASTSFAEVPWLQPYPDRLLDEVAPPEDQPDAVVVARETIELSFLAVIQVLAPRQRAVLILRGVLDWSPADTAATLDMTVPAVNSALQRARATLHEKLPGGRLDAWTATAPSAQELTLLAGFIDAHERADAAAAIALMREDIRITMPPYPMCFDGRAQCAALVKDAFGPGSAGQWRLVPIRANRLPAAASYLRRPGDTGYRAFKIDVLQVSDGAIAEITTFDTTLFAAFGLPQVLGEALIEPAGGPLGGPPSVAQA